VSRALRVATTLLMIGSFAACGGSERVDDATEEASVAPRFLSMGTAPPGGAFFVVGSALTEVLNEAGADQGFSVTAEGTSGSQENIRRLASGEIDFALSNAAISYFAIRGTEGWDRAYPIRSIMTLAPNVALFLTANGSGIETLTDLRDRRVSVGPAGAGFEYFVGPLLAAHGVTYDDFTPLNATQQAAVDMLADGASDAAFLGGAVPTASITQAAASMDVVFLPYGETEKQQLVEEFPFFRPATIPADTYRTQTETFEGLDTGSMHLITSADAPDDLIYAVTKMLYENRESVVEKHPAGRYINPNNVVRDTGTEFHPGAIRFFQEIGIWSE
jgi:TRAP transporter TAXI family solute receptor